jgi:polyisoprenoid-binding protein YceI
MKSHAPYSSRLALARPPPSSPAPPVAAETYTVDNGHTAVLFFAEPLPASVKVVGRFLQGQSRASTSLDDADAGQQQDLPRAQGRQRSTTNDGKRDEHLKGPDFFNAKQFPTATFASTAVKKAGDAFDVTGDLTIHGVKKSTTLKVKPNKPRVKDPFGTTRTGFDGRAQHEPQ